jgi:hypothetical protein
MTKGSPKSKAERLSKVSKRLVTRRKTPLPGEEATRTPTLNEVCDELRSEIGMYRESYHGEVDDQFMDDACWTIACLQRAIQLIEAKGGK